MALRFLYSGWTSSATRWRSSSSAGSARLLELLRVLLPLPDAEAKLVFNRDISINETEAIDQCGKSKGVISDETIVANHPWVSDVEAGACAAGRTGAQRAGRAGPVARRGAAG